MRGYISYSLNDFDDHITNIISVKLYRNKLPVTSDFYDDDDVGKNVHRRKSIRSSHVFLGVMAEGGGRVKWVHDCWLYALENNIPAILMIENNVPTNDLPLNHPNIIIFDRNYPEKAIATIDAKVKKARQDTDMKLADTVAWMLGELAAKLLVETFAHQKQEVA